MAGLPAGEGGVAFDAGDAECHRFAPFVDFRTSDLLSEAPMSALSILSSAATLSLLSVYVVAQSVAVGAPYPGPAPICVGDVNGDGRADYSGIVGGTARVYSDLAGSTIAHLTRPASGGLEFYGPAGDVNADGYDDLVWRQASGVATVVSGADGSTLHAWTTFSGTGVFTEAYGGGDFDADGYDDTVIRAGNVIEARSGRTGGILHSLPIFFGSFSMRGFVGDVNGDGYADYSVVDTFSGLLRLVMGPGFATSTMGSQNGLRPRVIGDINNNGTVDYIVRDIALNISQVLDSGTGPVLGSIPQDTSSGLVDVMPMGDFDGDGHDDFSVLTSPVLDVVSGATLTFLGATGIGPRPFGDVDGDGRQDGITGLSGQQVRCYWSDPTLPVVSRLVRRGGSGTTSVGHKPRVHTRGSCALGKNLFFDVRGQIVNGLSVLIVGAADNIDLAPLGAPGNRLYVSLDVLLLLLADGNGVSTHFLTMPVTPTLLGATCSVQAAAFDPAANAFGFVMSNAIDLFINN